jgi:hypothetical protein
LCSRPLRQGSTVLMRDLLGVVLLLTGCMALTAIVMIFA